MSYRVLRRLLDRRTDAEPVYLDIVPPVRSAAEMSALAARANWYFRDLTLPIVLDGRRYPVAPAQAPYMDPDLVTPPDWLTARPEGRRLQFHHRMSATAVLIALIKRERVVLAASEYYFYAERGWFTVRDRYGPTLIPSPEESISRLNHVRGSGRSAFILATGPSAKEVDVGAVDADVRITCNSAVRDLDRLRAFNPSIIAFADPVFHFGPSRYAAAFRRDLVTAVEATDALILTSGDYVAPLLAAHPGLVSRIAVLPTRDGGAWHWPTIEDPSTRSTGNILTNMLLPAAFSLADEVQIAGCDGRQPSENYFWNHDKTLQYDDDLMRSAFEAHPAFFRDRDYEDYYESHCRDLEEFFSVAESAGKRVRGVTRSWIPALRSRGAGAFGP